MNGSAESINPSEIVEVYRRDRPLYEAFTNSIDHLLLTLMKDRGIHHFSLEKRTKSEESLEEKIGREDKHGKYKSINHVTDLSGIRIIAYLKEECDEICGMIEDCFNVDRENSIDKSKASFDDRFGYRSTHYVVSFDESRTALPEFSKFRDLKCEIQIRTLLQHTWAAIDWRFRYKNDNEAPGELRRRLYRISALLEAADDDFSFVSEKLAEIKKLYSDKVSSGDLEIQFNADSYAAFVENNSSVAALEAVAVKCGMNIVSKMAPGSYDSFSIIANAAKIENFDQLEKLIQKFQTHAEKSLTKLVFGMEKKDGTFATAAIIRIAIFLSQNTSKRNDLISILNFTDNIKKSLALM
jgi:ppGpp synthetase/RelA/SpoT-type nucleotidyltranferase